MLPEASGMGRVTLTLAQDLSDLMASWLLSDELQRETRPPMEQTITLYTRAIERVLQAPNDSLRLIDLHHLDEWRASSREQVSRQTSEKEREP